MHNCEETLITIKPLIDSNVIELHDVPSIIKTAFSQSGASKFDFFDVADEDFSRTFKKLWSTSELNQIKSIYPNPWFNYFTEVGFETEVVLPHKIPIAEFHERHEELLSVEKFNCIYIGELEFLPTFKLLKDLDKFDLWDSITLVDIDRRLHFTVAFLKVNPSSKSAWEWFADYYKETYLRIVKHKAWFNDLLPNLLIKGFENAGLSKHPVINILHRIDELMNNSSIKNPRNRGYLERIEFAHQISLVTAFDLPIPTKLRTSFIKRKFSLASTFDNIRNGVPSFILYDVTLDDIKSKLNFLFD